MEVYTLDSLLRRETVTDRFESFIWTERFADVGDFELILRSTYDTRNRFSEGTLLAHNNSHRVMQVKTREDVTDDDGKAMLKVRGASLESMLEDRVAKDTMSNLTTEPKWVLTGTPGNIARQIFNDICVLGNLNIDDVIPFIATGNMFPTDSIAEPSTSITVSLDPQTVLAALKSICEMYDLGFRLTRNFDMSQLFFNVYAGSDRTSRQTVRPAVIFSPDLENLRNTNEFSTIDKSKNVAYVFSPDGYATVYPTWVDSANLSGLDRRVLVVVANDLTAADYPGGALATALQQRGQEELAKVRSFKAFDGEINQSISYVYGVDYNLGDLVEMRNVDGATNYMRVTEQIFVCDGEGERSYPTLTTKEFIDPGAWTAWEYYNRPWVDWGTTEYWADQP